MVNPDENVLVPDPGFPTYTSVLSYLGIEGKNYVLNKDDSWSIDLGEIESLIDDKTKLIIINSPSNPTGSIIDKDKLDKIFQLSKDKDIYILLIL